MMDILTTVLLSVQRLGVETRLAMSLENNVMLQESPQEDFHTYIPIAQFQYVESISTSSVLFMQVYSGS